MKIAIKSEVDSRILLYPLIRAIWSHGSVLVMTSNRQVQRLIDDVDASTFRDVTIIVDADATADSIADTYNIAEGDYDFVIEDNIGTADFDICFVPLGKKQSPEFDESVQLLLKDEGPEKVVLIQFGNPSTGTKQQKAQSKPRVEKGAQKDPAAEEYDPTARVKELVGEQRIVASKVFKTKFPSYEEIETVEAEHRFGAIDTNLITAFHSVLKDEISMDLVQYRKEVLAKDEYSGYLRTVEPSGLE